MSLTSSLFSGISGLTTLGNSMQIIGDNIANVNTIGFKGASYVFQDLLAQATATQSGTAQIGRGTSMGDVYSTFEQGSFESTGNTTDLAIGGDGFFMVREQNSDRVFYTRAGNFRFDKSGYLTNPEGYIMQGWQLDDNGDDIGSVRDIQLESFTSPPESSEHVTVIANLDSDADSNTSVLSNAWNGTNPIPIQSNNYEYQTTLKAYDSLGSTHDLSLYYDKVEGAQSDWEYLVTCNPDEDFRAGFAGTASAGLLARGRIQFSESSGTILPNGLTMETLTSATGFTQNVDNITPPTNNTVADTGIVINNSAAITTAGAVAFNLVSAGGTWQFSPAAPAGYPSATIDPTSDLDTIRINLDGQPTPAWDLTINFANTESNGESLSFNVNGSNAWTPQTTNSNGYLTFSPDFIGGASTQMNIELDLGAKDDGTGTFVNDSLTTTQFSRASTTTFQSADGYGAGDLQGVDVDVDGVITGIYSNGQLIELNRVALAKFLNIQGLHKEGGNLFRETRESGDAITNHPGTNGLGDISPNSLEQSNVDIATEFVKMITSQRGFQANSKIITTVDQMLAETIQMKR
jgi:flagellar hook protein FlgE